ncbi:filamentous hemagglutinin family protein, partial [Marinomonas alcarazii]
MLVLLRLLSRLVIQLATILSVTKCSTTRRVYFSYTSHLSLLQPCRKHQKYIAQIMLASYLSMPGVLLAQGVTAANTPHAPSFDRAANGVPIVNINKASSKGVSRNEYNGFNVESKGLIFNNATDIVNTQLAGYVDGNSNLNGLSANIILNEVKGNSRSALNGYMEIAGQSAELIIANQNGITCNGCGFINTTRGTLTTGQATFDGAGGLTGFDVSRGDVDISGLGLNAGNVDEVDILARSVSLNGKFWANNATIVTGQNHIDYQDKTITDLKADGPKALGSGISLDVAAIGGMYANRIRLIGTEKGLGVNVAGEIKAVEDMVLDSQGNLLNSGTLSAKTLTASSENISNTGAVLGHEIHITANQLNNTTAQANIQAIDGVTISTQELNNDASAKILSKSGSIKIDAGAVSNQSVIAADRINIKASSLENKTVNGQIFSTGGLDLTLTGHLNNVDGGLVHSDKVLTIDSLGDLVNASGTIEAVGSATIKSQNLTNSGTVLAQDSVLSIMTSGLENQGTVSGNSLVVNAATLDNSTENGKILSSGKLDLTIDGDVTNTDGALVHADTDSTLDAKGDVTNSGTIEAVGSTMIKSQNLTNSGTILAQDRILSIETNKIENQGTLSSNGLVIKAGELDNTTNTAQIVSSDKVDLTIQGEITNTDGALVHADTDLTLDAKGNLTNSGTVEAVGSSSLTTKNLTNSGTILAQDSSLSIETSKIDNQG